MSVDLLGAHRGHLDLAREAAAAGLVVTQMMPLLCRCGPEPQVEYAIELSQADGRLWAEGRHETAEQVREHVRRYATRRVDTAA